MIAVWWLCLIIPASVYIGMIAQSILTITKESTKDDSDKT